MNRTVSHVFVLLVNLSLPYIEREKNLDMAEIYYEPTGCNCDGEDS